MLDFKLIEVSETPYLYVSKSCGMAPADISQAMGAAFGQVWAFMQANDITPAGRALSVYDRYDPDTMIFRSGFSIDRADMSRAKGDVKADVTPAGEVIHFVHKGSYGTLRDDYALMMTHITNIGRAVSAPTWEVYLNSPDQMAEEDLRTAVYSMVK